MKKIVFIIYGFLNGGLERRVTNISNELGKKGFSVDIVAVNGVSENSFFELHKNVSIVKINEKTHSFSYIDTSVSLKSKARPSKKPAVEQTASLSKNKQGIKTRIKKAFIPLWEKSVLLHRADSLKFKKTYRPYFLKAKPDVVVSFGVNYHRRAVAMAKGKKCRLYDAEMNAHEKMIPQDRVGKRYYYKLLKRAEGIIVQTHSEKEFFEKDLKKVFVINNPVKPGLPEPYCGKRKKTIVNYCRVAPQKNLGLLINAFEKFHSDHPEYTLEIYGNVHDSVDQNHKNELIKMIEDKKLSDCAFVLPAVADIHERIIDSAMFVSSSDYEGMSNSMLEAMAIGLPCICTDCLGGGTREVITDHENGLIVPMNDSGAMCRAMKEFAENRALSEKCSRNAAKIREKLSVEKITDQWLDVLGL